MTRPWARAAQVKIRDYVRTLGLVLDLLNRAELDFLSAVLSAGVRQRVLEFFRLCRLCRYPGAAGEL